MVDVETDQSYQSIQKTDYIASEISRMALNTKAFKVKSVNVDIRPRRGPALPKFYFESKNLTVDLKRKTIRWTEKDVV